MTPQLADSVQTFPAVMSAEFKRRAVREPAPSDPNQATARTIQIMCGHVRQSARDPLVYGAAQAAIAQHGGMVAALGGYQSVEEHAARCIWWYAKHQLRFVHHQKQIDVWFGERHHLQLLISPDVLLRFPFRMEGDCAIYSMLICAMLQSIGIGWELVTVAWDPDQPDIFLHVYPRAVLPDGSRLALDASHGKFPGWSIPLSRRIRTLAWDESGAPVSDSGEQRFAGLHAYRVRVRPHLGFGQVDDTGGDTGGIDTSGTVPVDTSTPGTFVGPPALTPTDIGGSTGYVAPSQNSAAWANFAATLAKSGMTLAEINSIQPGTVVSPNGAILRQATGYPISGNPLASLSTSLSGAGGSSVLLIGGGVLLLVLLMGSMKR